MIGNFEVVESDLLGRIGRLETKHGTIETPALAPVINPSKNIVNPSEIARMGFQALMTNSYIIKRSYGELALEMGVHKLLGVDTPIMTDSGAYQLMVYGTVSVEPREIVEYQVSLGSDIGVILDIPTRYGLPREVVEEEVKETLRRAREALNVPRDGMLLVGPVQGGTHWDLVAMSARELSSMPFDVYAVGGPTQLMENYRFDELAKLILTAKVNLPPSRPLHLFGAGNPIMIPFAVAMGADMFDSASYALYAKSMRYMTEIGTLRFDEMKYLPCNCPVCSRFDIEDLREMPAEERVYWIALHNLYVLKKEVELVKEAIHEGRLWELLENRARTHPELMGALDVIKRYIPYIEARHPASGGRRRGLFFYGVHSRYRPEVYRHYKRLVKGYTPPRSEVLVLVPASREKPFSRFGWINRFLGLVNEADLPVHIVVYSPAMGVVPIELDTVYPLSQHEVSPTLLREVWADIANELMWYIRRYRSYYSRVLAAYRNSAEKAIVEKLRLEACAELNIEFYVKELPAELGDEEAAKELFGFLTSIVGGAKSHGAGAGT